MVSGRDATRAAGYMVFAMTVLGVIDNYVSLLAETISVWQFHLVRSTAALPLLALMPALGLGPLRTRRAGPVALRSALMAVSMMTYFGALGLMPIAQALAGLFTSPLFVLLISAAFLGRRFGKWRIMALILGFAGTLCVLQPDPRDFDWLVVMPVAAGLFYATSSIITREYCSGESTGALLLWSWVGLGLLGAAGLVFLQIAPAVAPDVQGFLTRPWVSDFRPALPVLAVQLFGSILAVFFLTRAYQIGETARVAGFEYTVMIAGPVYAWVALGQWLGPVQIGGIALILVAGAIIAIRAD